MARISEKALRPRQYVFNRLSAERSKKLEARVKKLLDREKLVSLKARANVRAVEKTQAARHAERILKGKQDPEPENDQIRILEKELEELRQKKRVLFETLKKALDSDDANDGDVQMEEIAKNQELENHGIELERKGANVTETDLQVK